MKTHFLIKPLLSITCIALLSASAFAASSGYESLSWPTMNSDISIPATFSSDSDRLVGSIQ